MDQKVRSRLGKDAASINEYLPGRHYWTVLGWQETYKYW